jgi:hypothetical protein
MLVIARAQGLSSYDATDLELAQRLGASLASFEWRLNEAGQVLDVALAVPP